MVVATDTPSDPPAFDVDAELDTSGLYCPEPIMLMHNKVRDMQAGQLLRVVASDPATTRDVPKFCQFLGHELVHQQEDGDRYLYVIRLG